eukprot:PhM_4_TR11564/c0_g1_i1/m.85568
MMSLSLRHRILESIDLLHTTSSSSLCFAAIDDSDDDPEQEQLSDHPPRSVPYSSVLSMCHVIATNILTMLKSRRSGVVLISGSISHGTTLALVETACVLAGVPFCPLPLESQSSQVYSQHVQAVLAAHGYNTITVDDTFMSTLDFSKNTDDLGDVLNESFCSDDDDEGNEVVYFMGTSGSTTGRPRLVMVPSHSLVCYLDGLISSLTIDNTSRVMLASLPSFDPSIGDIFSVLTSGATLLTSAFKHLLSQPTRLIVAAVPSHVVTSPSVWRNVDVEAVTSCITSARATLTVALGGQRMDVALAQRWCRGPYRLANLYGTTEAVGYQAIQWLCDDEDKNIDFVDVGRPLSNHISIEIDDDQTIVLRGRQVAAGYYTTVSLPNGEMEPMFEAFNGVHCTGDVAAPIPPSDRVGQCFRLLGRRDFQIKVSGQRVSLEEIEAILGPFLLPHVADEHCVVAINNYNSSNNNNNIKNSNSIVLVIRPKKTTRSNNNDNNNIKNNNNDSLIQQVVMAICRRVLSSVQQPHSVAVFPFSSSFISSSSSALSSYCSYSTSPFPITSNGAKTDRRALAEMLISSQKDIMASMEENINNDSLQGDVQNNIIAKTVRSVWQRVLQVPVVGRHTHFMASGGDSMMSLRASQLIAASLYQNGNEKLSDDGISGVVDRYGTVVGPLAPVYIAKYPTFEEYVRFLCTELQHMHFSNGEHNDGDVVVVLKEKKEEDDETLTLFNACVSLGDLSLVKALVQSGAMPTERQFHMSGSSSSRSALHLAVLSGGLELVQYLTNSFRIRPTIFDAMHVTPIHLSAQVSAPILKFFIMELNAPATVRDKQQQNLMHHAARAGNVDAIQFLLSIPSRFPIASYVCGRDKWRRTPLHWAIVNAHYEATECLAVAYTAAGFTDGEMSSNAKVASWTTTLPYESPLQLVERLHGGVNSKYYGVVA